MCSIIVFIIITNTICTCYVDLWEFVCTFSSVIFCSCQEAGPVAAESFCLIASSLYLSVLTFEAEAPPTPWPSYSATSYTLECRVFLAQLSFPESIPTMFTPPFHESANYAHVHCMLIDRRRRERAVTIKIQTVSVITANRIAVAVCAPPVLRVCALERYGIPVVWPSPRPSKLSYSRMCRRS